MKIQELIRDITHWEMMKGMIYPCLAPRRWEKVRSLRAVSRKFLDLAIYYIVRADDGDDMASAYVNIPLMRTWGIDMDTLDAQARENAKKDGYTIRDIGEFIGAAPSTEMYVMTNRYGRYGAAGMLDEAMLAQFADTKGADIYILPSCVHELILLPATWIGDRQELDEIVKDVNACVVGPEDRLADHAYRYERSGDIRMI